MDDEFKIIRCLMDMLSRNSLCEYTLNEQLITKRMFREIKSIQESDPVFYNIVRQNSKADFVEALRFIFSDGKSLSDALLLHMVSPLIARFTMKTDHIKFLTYSIIFT